MVALGMLFLPGALFAQGGYLPVPHPEAQGAPPVEQALAPEGFFAVQLAQALNLGQTQDEAQAEDLLSSSGIEPRNGWVADYPMTPDIVTEIISDVDSAADANRLRMGRDEAQVTVNNVLAGLGLTIEPANPGSLARGEEASPPLDVVNNYYQEYGAPVVTYYAPPPNYVYLYAWVPDPFWYGGFFFNGFYVLRDFDRHIRFHHRDLVVSNHFIEPQTHSVTIVNPARRRVETHARVGFPGGRESGLQSHHAAGGFHGEGFHGDGAGGRGRR